MTAGLRDEAAGMIKTWCLDETALNGAGVSGISSAGIA
jgi:hypothetical protein